MRNLSNIEASRFHHGQYVGYATYKGEALVYKIKRNGKRWQAMPAGGSHGVRAGTPYLDQRTLAAMSDSLSDLALT